MIEARKAVVLGLIGLLLVGGLSLTGARAISPDAPVTLDSDSEGSSDVGARTYTERGPIHIFHPWEFTAENGVVAGTGTAKDPYIISGWKIEPAEAATAIGVSVRDDVHVRISNNWVRPTGDGTGIAVGGNGHAVISNNVVNAAFEQVAVRASAGTNLLNHNTLINGTTGILVGGGETRIEGNHFQGQSWHAISRSEDGAWMANPLNLLLVRQNNFMDPDIWGVRLQYLVLDEANLADASDNYWGHPLGPRLRLHSSCCIGIPDVPDPRSEGGAYASIGVQPLPFASQPFSDAGAQN